MIQGKQNDHRCDTMFKETLYALYDLYNLNLFQLWIKKNIKA